jgi:hypothetical protein
MEEEEVKAFSSALDPEGLWASPSDVFTSAQEAVRDR